MSKLYKAIDKKDGAVKAFLVRDDGGVCKSSWRRSASGEIEVAKLTENAQIPCESGLKDAINPVLIAEW